MNEKTYQLSISAHQRFKELFPQGVNSPLRLFSEVEATPLTVKGAFGSTIVDIDGNQYTDFIIGLGALILGHAHSSVVEAIEEQVKKGTIFSCCHELEYDFAEAIVRSTPFIESLRFVCSGTEAVMGAIRTARSYTRKEKIIRFTGSYHGHADDVYYREEANISDWNEMGLVNEQSKYTLTCRYADAEQLESILESERNIAAVIIEPVASNMGLKVPDHDFLKRLRQLCDHYGCVLIFDEVVTGFRFCYGSVANHFGVSPDLVAFGKIIGGGLPVGCFAGRKEIMQIIEGVPGYFQGGTFAANPVTCAAGKVTLSLLNNPECYQELERKGRLFENQVSAFATTKHKIQVERLGSLLTLIPGTISDSEFVHADWPEIFSVIYADLLEEGLLFPPSVDEPIFISLVHEDDEIERAARVISEKIMRYLESNER